MGRLTGGRRVCGATGCDKVAIARGLCRTCYHRWWMTQSSNLSAGIRSDQPNPAKLQLQQERSRRYRHQNPDKARISARRYAETPAGKLARQRANERSKAWATTLRFLNRETPEAIAQKFPCLQAYLEQLIKQRPVSRTSIREILPEKILLELRRTSLNYVRYS